MTGFQVLPLGIGNAFSAKYYSSCLALGAQGKWLLIDCPHPIRKMMRDASQSAGVSLDIADISGIVITHIHGDHVSGLEDFAFFSYYVLDGKRTDLIALPKVIERLWPSHLAGGMEWSIPKNGGPPIQRTFDDFFRFHSLREHEAVAFGPFTIECKPAVHSIPTAAHRIRAEGRCLGHSADTAFDRDLIDWLAESDLLIHETGEGRFHTPYEKLSKLPKRIQKKMRLIHFPDDFDAAGSAIEPLREGRLYSV